MNLFSIYLDAHDFIVSSPLFSLIVDAHGIDLILFPALYA